MIPTVEQKSILEFIENNNKNLKISAYAGAGKTSTLKMIAKNNLDKSFLYIAYNKDIQLEAEKSFPKNVYCSTYHSLARRLMRIDKTNYKEKLSIKLKKSEVIDIMHLKEIKCISPYDGLDIIKKSLSNFKVSAESKPSEVHMDFDLIERFTSIPSEQKYLSQILLKKVELMWKLETAEKVKFPLDHDTYVKMWQLSSPKIDVDFILFDEAQDANPVVLDVVKKQTCRKIFVGDHHQRIYSWRGAVNAMQDIEAEELSLTQSFRFGNAVADIANKILSKKGERNKVLGFQNIESKLVKIDEKNQFTCICRTNAEVFNKLLFYIKQEKKVFVYGGVSDFIMKCRCAFFLYKNKRELITYLEFKKFKNWDHFIEHSKFDSELNAFVKIIKIHENNLLESLNLCEKMNVSIQDADILLCTAHKSKGLEWENVLIADDFNFKGEDELNLVYVASTRAKINLSLSEKFLKNIS